VLTRTENAPARLGPPGARHQGGSPDAFLSLRTEAEELVDAICLPNGNLVVPRRVESEDGQTVGDGFEEIGPDHPEYASAEAASRRSWPFPASTSTPAR